MTVDSENRILVIDDEMAVRHNIAAYLEDSGYVVFQAENGKKGLDLYFQERPDAVLVDLDMPELNGFEVLTAIREDSFETPVIVVSGVGEVKNAVEASRLGAWDFILKPIFNMEIVEHTIEKSMERKVLQVENRQYRENLERLVRIRTMELENRNTELVDLNKRLRIEISDRKLAEAQLSQAKERSIALRRFSNRIAEFNDEAQLLKIAMDELCTCIYMSGAILFFDFQDNVFKQRYFGNPPLDFLKKPPDFQLLKQLFINRSQEVSEFKYINKRSPIGGFFSETEDADVEGGHFIYFRGKGPHHHLFCFYRERLFSPFEKMDIEYVKSIINEINNAYYSIQMIRENVWMEQELRTVALEQDSEFQQDTLLVSDFEMKADVFLDFEMKPFGYKVIDIDDRQSIVIWSDIPERRMSAAMYSRIVYELLLANENLMPAPLSVLSFINQSLQTEFQPNHSLSISFFWLYKDTGEIRYFFLGKEPLVMIKITGDRYEILKSPRFPFTRIGSESLMERFKMEQVALESGEMLIGFSPVLLRRLENENSDISPESLYETVIESRELAMHEITQSILDTLKTCGDYEDILKDASIFLLKRRVE